MLKEIDEEYLNWISDEEKHLKAALISINEVRDDHDPYSNTALCFSFY